MFWGNLYNSLVVLFQNAQFHLYAPSEHTVDGVYYQLELHFVHTVDINATTKVGTKTLAVVGVFFEIDEEKRVFGMVSH